jgi:hypothetical protein
MVPLMRILIGLLLLVSTGFAQDKVAPQQGPPPKNLTQLPDGHFSANADPANVERFEVHIVQTGETLSQIAGQVLNNPRLWPQLWEQNEHIVNPHWIYPNDKILVRPVTQITEALPPPPPPEPPPAPPAPPLVPQPGQITPAPEPQVAEDFFILTPPRRFRKSRTVTSIVRDSYR